LTFYLYPTFLDILQHSSTFFLVLDVPTSIDVLLSTLYFNFSNYIDIILLTFSLYSTFLHLLTYFCWLFTCTRHFSTFFFFPTFFDILPCTWRSYFYWRTSIELLILTYFYWLFTCTRRSYFYRRTSIEVLLLTYLYRLFKCTRRSYFCWRVSIEVLLLTYFYWLFTSTRLSYIYWRTYIDSLLLLFDFYWWNSVDLLLLLDIPNSIDVLLLTFYFNFDILTSSDILILIHQFFFRTLLERVNTTKRRSLIRFFVNP